MEGTNEEDDISSNGRNSGSRLLYGEGDLFVRFLLIGGGARKNHLWMLIKLAFGFRLDCQGEAL